MKTFVASLAIATLLLIAQGCGSHAKKSSTTNVTLPTKAVHIIKPEDVAEYIEIFSQQQSDLQLQISGEVFTLSLVDLFMADNIIAAKYAQGYVLIGMDFNQEEPINFLKIIESDLPFEEALASPINEYNGATIEISEVDHNYVYEGTLIHAISQDIVNVHLVFNESLISGGNSIVQVQGTKATVNGDLGTNTYLQLQNVINNHPEVSALVLQSISGSLNDAINMHTGRLVRNAGLMTIVEESSAIYSGGVDLYAAGKERKYKSGAKIGVHSWCCVDGVTADKLGRGHSGHGAQLTYFREMLGQTLGPEFYFFTIEAAPFDGAHEMSKEELDKYLLN